MRSLRVAAVLLVVTLTGLALVQAQDRPGRKYALLVGVKEYLPGELGNLRFTENDVNDLAALLKDQLHYHRVVVLTQGAGKEILRPTYDYIQEHLKSILEDCEPQDQVLLAFSGHGLQMRVTDSDGKDRTEAFFCPCDARPTQRKNLLALSAVYDKLHKECKAGAKLLLVDACREEKEGRKGTGDDFLPADPPAGVAALFSCSSREFSFEDPDRPHSIFMHYVIEGLKGGAVNRRKEITVESLADYLKYEVRDRVKSKVSPLAKQNPQLKGEFGPITLASGVVQTKDGGERINLPPSRFKPVQPVPQATRNLALVRHLFLGYQGLVNINSCKPGQKALGDVFTPILVKNLTEWKGGATPSWESFFNVLKNETADRIKELLDKGLAPAFLGLNDPKAPEKKLQETQTPYSFDTFENVKARRRTAGVVRALVICDDNSKDDADFNQQVRADALGLLGMLYNFDEICPNPIVLSGRSVTRDRILDQINSRMDVNPDDTLFVYYVGSGRQENKDTIAEKGHYLDLLLPGKDPNRVGMWRTEILKAMEQRKPSLRVLITDACFAAASSGEDGIEIKPIGSRFKDGQKIPEQSRTVSIVQHLFREHGGLVNINSCKPGQLAVGDVFTPILVKNLAEWKGEPTPSWESFFKVVQEGTSERIKDLIDKGQAPSSLYGEKEGKQGTQTPYSFDALENVKARRRTGGVVRALVIVDDNSEIDPDYDQQVHGDAFGVLGMLHNLAEICPNPIMLTRKSVTRDSILDRINNKMEVDPDDTLFVYYVGPGGQANKDTIAEKGHYLDLHLPGKEPNRVGIWRTEILKAMEQRKPRLRVLITDSSFGGKGNDDRNRRAR